MPKQNMLQHTAHLSRSGFDMSQSYAFTAAPGMLLPVYSDLLTSGDTVRLTTDFFARTQPLVTPAMIDVDFYLEWFFVPATMLLTSWGQVREQTMDFVTSFMKPSMFANGNFPIMDSTETFSVNAANFSTSSPFYENPNTGVRSTLGSAEFDSNGKSMFRMLDALGFNPRGVFQNIETGTIYNPNVFPIRALAYQCIYQWFYRNDDYEPLDIRTYNWDQYQTAAAAAQSFVSDNTISALSPFVLRYADYRKDYFTSIKPSPINSSVSMLNGSEAQRVLANINNYLSNADVTPSTLNSTDEYNDEVSVASSGIFLSQFALSKPSSTSPSYPTAILGNTSGALRSLFAVEKLARITGRASKDYDSQVLAHLGFKIKHDIKHQATRLHTSHAILHIGEVVGTADTFDGTSGSALGELAGKGYVSINDKKKVTFTAPVDGIIMCVFHCIPRLRVEGAFDKQNSITNRLDLFIPEFDKLGMQPLYDYEFLPNNFGISSEFRGWQLRYDQYKRKYDRVSAVFSSPTRNQGINQYSAWVGKYSPLHRETIPTVQGVITPDILKCPPTALNNIMVVPYLPAIQNPTTFQQNPATEFYTDPFICDFRANITKVSAMSPSGEPDMISL